MISVPPTFYIISPYAPYRKREVERLREGGRKRENLKKERKGKKMERERGERDRT